LQYQNLFFVQGEEKKVQLNQRLRRRQGDFFSDLMLAEHLLLLD